MGNISTKVLARAIADYILEDLNMARQNPLMTYAEIAQELKISKPTVDKYVRQYEASGGRGVLRTSSFIRVPRKQFYEFLEGVK